MGESVWIRLSRIDYSENETVKGGAVVRTVITRAEKEDDKRMWPQMLLRLRLCFKLMKREPCLIVKDGYASARSELFSQPTSITGKKQSSKIEARRFNLPMMQLASPSPT